MKVLFAHRSGALGGLLTQLLNRMPFVHEVAGVSAEFVLERDDGIARTLAPYGPVHVERDLQGFRKLVDARRYDVVIVIDTEEYLPALRDSRARPAVILEVHTTAVSRLEYLGRNSSGAGVIVPSEYSRRLLASRHGIPDADIRVVPNSVDPAVFRPVGIEKPASRPIVLWVGRLEEDENWVDFVEVAALLSPAASDVEFWLVGGATAPEEAGLCLLATVDAFGLMSRFRWFPLIEYGAMAGLYSYVRASGGALLVTSRDDSFGTSIAESLLTGCPVVSSRVGAIPEIARERPHLRLYPPGDTAAASQMLRRTLFDDLPAAHRTLGADRSELAARLSPDTTGPIYLTAVRELAARGR